MKWTIQYSDEALKFAEREKLFDEVRQEIKKLVQKIKRQWSGYYRIRKGKLRIIFAIEKENKIIFIERIDYRGEVYIISLYKASSGSAIFKRFLIRWILLSSHLSPSSIRCFSVIWVILFFH